MAGVQALFYRNPIALNRNRNRDLRINFRESNLGFSADTNSVPIVGGEFPECLAEFPIFFARAENDYFPIALLGLRSDENLFVDQGGQWQGRYVPAFVRRYPFVLAEKQDTDDFDVCVDQDFPGLGDADGERLFTESGENSEVLTRALDFLSGYQGEIKRTRLFCERLRDLELFKPGVLNVKNPEFGARRISGVHMVDEERLQKLEDAEVLSLFRAGYLGWIHAHLLSLGNLKNLSMRLDARVRAAESEEDPVMPA